MARALDISCFNLLEARVSYVSSCTSSVWARVPHVSYVYLVLAIVLYVINPLTAGAAYIRVFIFY